MSIGEICTRDVVVINSKASVQEAAGLMRQLHVGCLVVVEEREGTVRPAGMLTDRDIVIEALAQEVDVTQLQTGDIMSRELLTARTSDGLWDTLKRMRAKGVRRAPVINERGALEGLITVDDLLELLADELSDLARLVAREREQEARARK